MVSPNVSRILQEAQRLSDAEREELRSLLAQRAARCDQLTKQEQVRQALVARGLLEKEPPSGKDPERFRRWQPIPIKGEPQSRTIIEERR
jgi:hypothetical protein